jgi:hypothetical protein
MRLVDYIDVRSEGAQLMHHQWFHTGIGDQCHGMAVRDAGQRQAEAQRAAGGLDDRGARP